MTSKSCRQKFVDKKNVTKFCLQETGMKIHADLWRRKK